MKRREFLKRSTEKIKRLKRKNKRLKHDIWKLKHLREVGLDDLAKWWADEAAVLERIAAHLENENGERK